MFPWVSPLHLPILASGLSFFSPSPLLSVCVNPRLLLSAPHVDCSPGSVASFPCQESQEQKVKTLSPVSGEMLTKDSSFCKSCFRSCPHCFPSVPVSLSPDWVGITSMFGIPSSSLPHCLGMESQEFIQMHNLLSLSCPNCHFSSIIIRSWPSECWLFPSAFTYLCSFHSFLRGRAFCKLALLFLGKSSPKRLQIIYLIAR